MAMRLSRNFVSRTWRGKGVVGIAVLMVGTLVHAAALPPIMYSAIGAPTIPLNGTTSLQFNIANQNSSPLTGVGFSDTLPAGLVVSTPNGLSGSCGGGTITSVAGTGTINLSGATLAGGDLCTFSINITGTSAGFKNNTTGSVTSNEGGSGTSASSGIVVVAPPSIAAVFTPSTIETNQTTSLQFTISNPAVNMIDLSGIAFSDTLPVGLTVPNTTTSVCGGTLTLTSPTGIAMSGATIAPVAVGSPCQFSVTVSSAAAGNYTNTTGAVTSTYGGAGNTASANLSVGNINPQSPPAQAPAIDPLLLLMLAVSIVASAIVRYRRISQALQILDCACAGGEI